MSLRSGVTVSDDWSERWLWLLVAVLCISVVLLLGLVSAINHLPAFLCTLTLHDLKQLSFSTSLLLPYFRCCFTGPFSPLGRVPWAVSLPISRARCSFYNSQKCQIFNVAAKYCLWCFWDVTACPKWSDCWLWLLIFCLTSPVSAGTGDHFGAHTAMGVNSAWPSSADRRSEYRH